MRIITAKYAGDCASCTEPVNVGDSIAYTKGQPVRHAACPAPSFAEVREYQQERAAAKAERFSGYSDNAAGRSDAAMKRFHDIADNIPLGQPILIGHHSEGHARRDRARMDNALRKSAEEDKRADHWEHRAEVNERKAQGDETHTVAFVQRRIEDAEGALRDIARRLDGYGVLDGYGDILQRSEISPAYRDRLLAMQAEQQDKLHYWQGIMAAKGGVRYSRENVKKGDTIIYQGQRRTITRVNPKSVTVMIPAYYGTNEYPHTVPYAEIKGHQPATGEPIKQQEKRTADPAALFAGVFPTGIGYADRTREVGGDYQRIAFLPFDTLTLQVYQPTSPLLPLVEADAASIQARRGERYQVSTAGQYVTLGYKANA